MKTPLALLLCAAVLLPCSAFAVHDDQGNTQCLDCHQTLPFDREKLAYTDETGNTCRQCSPIRARGPTILSECIHRARAHMESKSVLRDF